jgi:hypothetical protein
MHHPSFLNKVQENLARIAVDQDFQLSLDPLFRHPGMNLSTGYCAFSQPNPLVLAKIQVQIIAYRSCFINVGAFTQHLFHPLYP